MKKKIITLTTDEKNLDLSLSGMKIIKRDRYSLVCEIDLETTTIERLIHETLKLTSLKDITIEDPTMNEIIQNLYKDNAKIL